MNLESIRAAVQDLLSWKIGDDVEDIRRLDRNIDQGYRRCITDCPPALVPKTIRVINPRPVFGGAGEAVGTAVYRTTDPWCMQFFGGTFQGPTDGTGNGIYWLYAVVPSTGETVRFQIREFFTLLTGERLFTLDRPWTFIDPEYTQWSLRCPVMWLPAEVTEVLDCQMYGSDGGVMTINASSVAVRTGMWKNVNNQYNGVATALRRDQFYAMQAPTRAPEVGYSGSGSFGPEPFGTFDYCYTYCWGYRHPDLKSNGGNFIPLFESTASPVSAEIATSGLLTQITVQLPNVAWELNFDNAGTTRAGHSGWYKRVYRRRKTVTGGTNSSIEYPYVFQMLADVDDTVTSYTDDGSIVPDASLRLPEVGGYWCWDIWPEPVDKTEYELRCSWRPPPMINASDSPALMPECMGAITFFAAAFMARVNKDPDYAAKLERDATKILNDYRSKYANPTGRVARKPWDSPLPVGGWPRFRGTP